MRYYFAGAETHYDKLAEGGVEDVLCTYLVFNNRKDLAKRIFENPQFKHIAIDSGAHSFQKDVAGVDMKQFVLAYKNFIKEHKDNPKVDWFAEMDIEGMVGLPQVERWFDTLRNISDKVMPVWHPERGVKNWERYCRENKFVGTGGTWKFMPVEQLIKLSVSAYDAGASHHGFGCTSTRLMSQVPMFSTDSTSWLAGEQYGQVIRQEGTTYNMVQRGGRRLSPEDPSIIEITKPYKRRTDRMIQHYKEHARFITALWASRGIVFKESKDGQKSKSTKR